MTKLRGVKNVIMQVTCLEWIRVWFVFLLWYYFTLRESDFLRNSAIILPLKSKLSGKFQRFNTLLKVLKYWKVVELRNISIIWKTVKWNPNSDPLYESYSASPHLAYHQIRCYYVFVTNIFLVGFTKIYRHLLPKCFMKVVLRRQEKCSANVFSDTKQNNFCWKICKLRTFFGCVLGAYYFQFQRSWDL